MMIGDFTTQYICGLSQSIYGEPLLTHQYEGTIEGFEHSSFDHILSALVGSKGFSMFASEYTHHSDYMMDK